MSQGMKSNKQGQKISPERIGLIPAAGQATRISPLPCSKELYPLGFRQIKQGRSIRPKVVCHYLLEKMHLAGVSKAYVILRKNKWDIPAYFGDGKFLDMHLAYLMLGLPYGVPYTLDQAYPFLRDEIVVFGFPDIICYPDDVFVQLLSRQEKSNADVVLGLFPARQPQKVDMVELGPGGRVLGIQIKPSQTHLRYAWIIAVWTSEFTHFMHEFVLTSQAKSSEHMTNRIEGRQKEIYLGEVIGASIKHGMRVDRVFFEDGFYLDIGTSEDLAEAIRNEITQSFPHQGV
jgi:glucose-1-phosphate thymidylyltransferase